MSVVPITPATRLSRFTREGRKARRVRPMVRKNAMTAAAMSVDIKDRTEARRIRLLRQGWQQDAFAYAKAVPEASFAYRFIVNAHKRMRVKAMGINPEDPDGAPVPLDVSGAPQQVIESCNDAMGALGVGRIAKAALMEPLARGTGIPGECWLVGREDPDTGEEEWSVRSIAEVMVMEDEYKLREIPLDPQGQMGWVTLDPATTYIARMWVPDAEFRILADSPMRALLDTCEELLLLGRDVRAISRSRIAGAGLLTVPEGLSVQTFGDDNNDLLSDDFIGRLAEMMMVPIAEEGVASSVVPGVIRGEPEQLAQIRHIAMDRPYSALAMQLRTEAIGRLANGLDVPRAIVLGLEDVNHWGQWQISEDTFRHHLEPGVITAVDCLTLAFLRPWLEADGVDPYWVERCVMWYDPVELVTHPDQTSDAITLYNLKELSGDALRRVTGFTDADKPNDLELVTRAVGSTKTWPPNALLAILARLDPTLTFPPITASGTFPGIKAGSVDPAPPPPAPGTTPPAGAPAIGLPQSEPSALPSGGEQGPSGPSAPPTPSTPGPPATTSPPEPATSIDDEARYAAFAARAMADAQRIRLSRKLTEIDAVTRAKLQAAACASMVRVLEKAGAKLRTTANGRKYKDGIAKQAIASTPNALVASVLGPSVVAAMGFPDHHALLDSDWSDMRSQFYDWVSAAQKQAVLTAAQLANVPASAKPVASALAKMDKNLDDAWAAFVEAMSAQAEALLYNPMPNAPDPGEVVFNPATVVPVGLVRRVLGIAGGNGKHSALTASLITDVGEGGPDSTAAGGAITAPVDTGGIGNGSDVSDFLTGNGMEVQTYTWEHNYGGDRPLDGHLALDGVSFASFDDDVLANPDSFPDNAFFMPGDHDGCMCDYVSEWGPADDGGASGEADTEQDTSDEGAGGDTGDVSDTQDTSDQGPSLLSQAVDALSGDTAEDAGEARAAEDLAEDAEDEEEDEP